MPFHLALCSTVNITVAIVEDEGPVREFMQLLIDRTVGLRCVAAYANPESALEQIPCNRPDVLLMDLNLPSLSGVECVRFFRQQSASLKILMLTESEDSPHIFEALRAGANGFILKRNLAADLLPAIRQATEGGAPMFHEVAARVVAFFHEQGETSSTLRQLSPRESQVLDYLAKGYRYKGIAKNLGITYDTVNGYIKSIYEKLHVHSRGEAVAKYLSQ